MKVKYVADDGRAFDSAAECELYEAQASERAKDEDLARRRREDFDFMVLCEWKGNRGMYELLRDKSL